LTLIQAVGLYVGSFQTNDDRVQTQQELLKFTQWFGPDRAISDLAPPQIGEYAEQTAGAGSTRQTLDRLESLRKFLTFAKKKGLTNQNLATHLRVPKGKARSPAGSVAEATTTTELTEEGHRALVSELDHLRAMRGPLAADIRRAAADKDVRENAPLEAARERLGHVESQIRHIEADLLTSVVVGVSGEPGKVIDLGSKVLVRDVDSGRETAYTLVGASEARPLEGKISSVSPVGKALLQRSAGQEVEADTPRGKLRYRILKVS
jgi:transcription elongation factor GreA